MAESIPEFLAQVSQKYGDRTAFYIRRFLRTTKFSYREIAGILLKVATYLLDQNLKSGDSVLIWAPNMPEWVLAFFGALSAGIVVVPVGLHSTSEVVEKYIQQTRPKILFTSKFYPIDLKKPGNNGLKVIFLEDIVGLVEHILPKKLPVVANDDLAEIVFTSGTTGEPKGVMITHGNILYEIEQLLKTVPRYKHYRLLSVLPLSHVMEQIVGLIMPMFRGATIYYLPRINAVTIRKALAKYHITDLGVVPQMMRMFLDTIEYQVEESGDKWLFDLMLKITPKLPIFLRRGIFGKIHQSLGNKLYVFGVGSAPLDIKLAQAWEAMGIKVVEGYGASETTGGVTANRVDHRKLGSVGKRLPGMEIILSPEKEILVKGDNVTSGYFKNDEKTKEAFTSNSYFRTGDVGYFDKDGWLYITGREKFKIVTAAGDKVYPEDVERKLNAHPDVWDSCVMGIKKGDGEIVYATLILKEKAKHNIDEIVKQVNTTLEPNQQILSSSLWLEKDFPRLHTLKVDRNIVKTNIEARLAGKETQQGSVTVETRDKIKEIISEVCKVSPQNIQETSSLVTDLGLDSLKRVELVSLIEEELEIETDESLITPSTRVSDLRTIVKRHAVTKYPYDLDGIAQFLKDPFNRSLKVVLQNLVLFPIYRFYVNPKCVGMENLKNLKTPVIFVGNHPSTHDGVSFLSFLPEKIRNRLIILGDDAHWRGRGWERSGKILEIFAGAFPINKKGGAIRKPLESLVDFLEDGYNLLILPEGKYTPEGIRLAPFHKGVEVLLEDSNFTLVPYFVSSKTRQVFNPHQRFPQRWVPRRVIDHATVKIGRPFNLKEKFGNEALMEIRSKILALETDD